jgi:hypothetical protein
MEYTIRRAVVRPELTGDWDGPAWREANVAAIAHFHPAGSDHRPRAEAKLLYDDEALYALFRVSDRYVVCRRTEPQSAVCKDSCVELFLQPDPGPAYLNFETNCGGTMLLYHVHDPSRGEDGKLRGFRPVATEHLRAIRVFHSLPAVIEPERAEPTEWRVELAIPNPVFEAHTGPLAAPARRRWRGNFYKCADESSHPHWGSWSPIGDELNFHRPEFFGDIRFEA